MTSKRSARRAGWTLWPVLLGLVLGAGEALAVDLPTAYSRALVAVEANDCPEALKALASLPDPQPDTLRPRILFLTGYCLLKTDRPADALPVLEQAAAAYDLLADYALFYGAQAARTLHDAPTATGHLSRLVTRYPESRLAAEAHFRLAMTSLDLQQHADGEKILRAFLDRYPASALAAEATLALGKLFLALERPQEGLPLLKQLYISRPADPAAAEAEDLLRTNGHLTTLTPEEHMLRARAFFHAERYRDAVTVLRPLVVGDPQNAESRLLLGRSLFAIKEYPQVVTTLLPVTDAAAPPAHQPEALLLSGRAFLRSGDTLQAIATLERIVAAFPDSLLAGDALSLIGLSYEEQEEWEAALEVYARLLRFYPQGHPGDSARWRRAWLVYRQGKLEAAVHELGHLLADYSHSSLKPQALYWRARWLEESGEKAAAAKAFHRLLKAEASNPYAVYYVQAARQRLGLKPARLPTRPQPSVPDPPPAVVAKARALVSLRLTEQAAAEYWEIARAHPQNLPLLWEACWVLAQANQFDRVVTLARRILPAPNKTGQAGDPHPAFWTYLYPRAYWPWVDHHAREVRLDPYLVMAVMREESAFAPTALSRAGARGLMQLMPATATRVAAETNFPSSPDVDTPGPNIALGTRYLAQLLEEFGGDLALTLAAYNAGPHNVRRWLKNHHAIRDSEVFVEEIPYPETQRYVKRVLASYDRYRALYAGPQ